MANLNVNNQDQRISNRIINLFNEYIEAGGSCRYSMWQLRENFSRIIPYEDPWFHVHFSVFARDAIANNLSNGRPVYNIGGDPPPIDVPIRDTLPWIIPAQDENRGQQQEQQQLHQQNQPDPFLNQQHFRQRQQHQQEIQQRFQNHHRREDQQAEPERVQDNEGRRRRRKKTRRDRDERDEDLSSDLSNSEDTDHGVDKKPQLPFEKRKQRTTSQISKERQIIIKATDAYREAGLSFAARSFERLADKPINFPNAFIKDLLQFKFIDMEKLLQEISPEDSDKSKVLEFDPNSKKLE